MSWLWAMGIMPDLLIKPRLGLRPTTELAEAGLTIDPSVSVPMAAAQKFAATAAAEPELEPDGFLSKTYGLRVNPPRLLQPLVERFDLMLAHSLRLVFPRIIAPASRSLFTRKAS